MREITIFKILCEINPKNKKIRLPKSLFLKVTTCMLLRRACQNKFDDVKIVEIQARM
jgi:hypothetical protein